MCGFLYNDQNDKNCARGLSGGDTHFSNFKKYLAFFVLRSRFAAFLHLPKQSKIFQMSSHISLNSTAANPTGKPVCGQKIIYCKQNPETNPNTPKLEMIVPCGQPLEPAILELRKKGFFVAGKDF